MGNLVFRGGSQNFNVSFAKAARVTIVEAEEIVPTGSIPPEDVDLPGVFVTRVVPVTVRMDVKNLPMRVNRPASSARIYFGKPALTREQIGRRVAALLPDGAVVNLGAGLPTQVANFTMGRSSLHSENGMLNYGEFVRGDDFDPDLHDAGGYFVTPAGRRVVLRQRHLVRDRARRAAVRGGARHLPGGRQRRPGELVGARHGGRRHRRRDGPRRREHGT